MDAAKRPDSDPLLLLLPQSDMWLVAFVILIASSSKHHLHPSCTVSVHGQATNCVSLSLFPLLAPSVHTRTEPSFPPPTTSIE